MKNSISDLMKTVNVNDQFQMTVIPFPVHEYLMTSKQVSEAYGVDESTIRRHLKDNASEFTEGKHFIKGVSITHTLGGVQPHQTLWAKRGVVRFGFLIKTERGRIIRDFAEDLIMELLDPEIQEVKDLMIQASAIIGSTNKLAKHLNLSPATFTNLVKRPGLLSAEMFTKIKTACTSIVEHGVGVDPELVELLLEVDDKETRKKLWKKYYC